MRAKKYVLSLVTVYLCYFTHGMQALILSQNMPYFYEKWGYTDATAGAAAVSLAITATGFGKFISVWIGGEISDKIGRKKMAIGGAILYIICFAGLLLSPSMMVASVCAFMAGVATSGFWDASLYPAVQEAAPKYAGSALIGIKLFVSLGGIFYPLMVVNFTEMGSPQMNVIIPLVLSVACLVLAALSPFVYDDLMKGSGDSKDGNHADAIKKEIDDAKAKLLIKPNTLVNFITMFYAFLCMFIMYGAQQYTKAFGLSNAGLSEIQAAGLTSIYTFGGIIAVVFWAIMMGKLRWNPLKVLVIDSIFTALALAIVLIIRHPAVIYISIAALGFFASGGALQTGLGVRQMFCPGPKGRNTGIYYTFMGFASTFLPFIVSAMTRSVGETRAVYLMMILLLAAAVIATVMMFYLVGQHKKVFGYGAFERLRD
ncbi:MFS transporter [Candidatus Enterococcus ferrettii]|uniref:Major facilitator superfamily (MFS) profile domain-containing protein n=1 Tax=Candidatus Enterococcus ferrettii TaxID=2815324 RepID=A0ABV0EVI9_9ENTE|nr:MFS transporter [Enterococcus sp. 665A]MBO1338688.1 MFS transporter [Enterococcus sp. 665A]